jgi:hypothetical protein
MNKVILLVLLMPIPAFGQIIVNFESNSITGWVQGPEGHWNTDNANSISGMYSLHHSYDNPDAGMDRIGFTVNNFHPGEGAARWSFTIRYGCDPSASNNWAVWLMSDTGPVSSPNSYGPNGFAVGVNLTGYDDTLRLWKVKNGIFSPVISSGINWQTEIGTTDAVRIALERSQTGHWILQVFRSNDFLLGSSAGNDPEIFNPGWFILTYKYTSTRDRLLWFDDLTIDGVFYEDNEPPVVSSCEITGRNSLLISFNEDLSEGSLSVSNFLIETGNHNAFKVIRENSCSFIIEFEKQFINKVVNRLIISKLCDKLLNCRDRIIVEFTPAWIESGDVIISEIMADPIPAVSLPEKEYFELHNRTQFTFNTKNWTLTDGSQNLRFPEKIIQPEKYIIVCSALDTLLFSRYGNTIGFKSFPALEDGGKILAITDSNGNLIHGTEYSSDWYGDVLKEDGGWSLEITDKDYPFFQEGNWQASLSKEGGSPGKANSVSQFNPDKVFTGIENVFPADSNSIILRLSETVIGLQNNMGSIKIDGSDIKSLHTADPLLRTCTIVPGLPLQRGTTYTMTISSEIADFAGNQMERSDFRFGIPEKAGKADILFNELLFNPLPERSDYVEFYNNSDKILDASGLLLVSVNDENMDTSSVYVLSSEGRCLLPGNYYVITDNKKSIIEIFPSAISDQIFEVPSLPSMPDDKGHLILYNRELDKIDEVFYDEKMHFSLLQGNEGISLEKIKNQGLSTDRSLWHSASESSGWGTPGAPNSIFLDQPGNNDKITFSSTKITPDNDGNEDFLVIDLRLTGLGNVVSISVFDETGHFVKKLTDNLFAGPEASVVWNGTADDEELVSTGIYIILITVFDDKGKVEKWKKVCSVIR